MSEVDEPERLGDDPEVPAQMREDLSRTASTRSRRFDSAAGLARLGAAIGAGGVVGAAATTKAATASTVLGLGARFWGLTGVGTAAVVGGFVVYGAVVDPGPQADDAARTHTSAVATATVGEPQPALVAGATGPPAPVAGATGPPAPEAPAMAQESPPLLMGDRSRPRAQNVSPDSRPSAVRTSARSTTGTVESHGSGRGPSDEDPDLLLREETRHLRDLQALAARDPAAALRAADEGQARFGRGMFSEERLAIAILALERLGRLGEARERGRRFLARHPRGPSSERIRGIVGD